MRFIQSHSLQCLCWALIYFAFSLAAIAANKAQHHDADVDKVLALAEPPAGVVFEVLDWEDGTWVWAAPKLQALTDQLRAKFPDIDVVIVSHGEDQFQLTKDALSEQPQAIAELKSLTESGVDLHVCGAHSGWRDVPEAAYLDFVDVSPSGPAQINDYVNLGYVKILLQAGY